MAHTFTELLFHVRYIQGQAEHHRKMTFEEEFVLLSQKHGMEFDEGYVWK